MGRDNACFSGFDESPIELGKVLVPLDFSDCSIQALPVALNFAKQFNGEITLLAVIPDDHNPLEYGESEFIKSQERCREQFQNKLFELANEKLHGIHYHVVVRTGRVVEEIVRCAKELDLNLIIISTRGCSGIQNAELGSTTERVVRHATCPVLVVRPQNLNSRRQSDGKLSSTESFSPGGFRSR